MNIIYALINKTKNEEPYVLSKALGIDTRTVQRYFIRFFKSRFKISDLE